MDTDKSTRGEACACTGIKCTCVNASRSVYDFTKKTSMS